jgi:hypothetical protein
MDTKTIPPVITYPLGSDVLKAGHVYYVAWQNKDPDTVNYSINLEYVDSGNYFKIMSLGVVSSKQQSIVFKIPSDIQPRTNYQLYFSNTTNGDVLVGSQAFTIK